jgi:hypothetical protein
MARLADRDHLTLTARGVEDIPEFVDVNLFAASHGLMCPNVEGNRRADETLAKLKA